MHWALLPRAAESLPMHELAERFPRRGFGFVVGIAERDQFGHGHVIGQAQNLVGLFLIEQAGVDGAQAEGAGGEAEVFGGDAEVEHPPVAEHGGHDIFVIAGLALAAAGGDYNRGLHHGVAGGVAGGEALLQFGLERGVGHYHHFPGLDVGPAWRPAERFEHLVQYLGRDRVALVFAHAPPRLDARHRIHFHPPSTDKLPKLPAPAPRLGPSARPQSPNGFGPWD